MVIKEQQHNNPQQPQQIKAQETRAQNQTQGLEFTLSNLRKFLEYLLREIPDSDTTKGLLVRLHNIVKSLEELQNPTVNPNNILVDKYGNKINSQELASVLFNAAARIIASYEMANNTQIQVDKEVRRLINKYKSYQNTEQKVYSHIERVHISTRLSEWEKAVSEAQKGRFSYLARTLYLAKTPIRASVRIEDKQEQFEGVNFVIRSEEDVKYLTALILTSNVSFVSYDKENRKLILQDNSTKKYYFISFGLFKSAFDVLENMIKLLDEISQNPMAVGLIMPVPIGMEIPFAIQLSKTGLQQAEQLARFLLGNNYDNSDYAKTIAVIKERVNQLEQRLNQRPNQIDRSTLPNINPTPDTDKPRIITQEEQKKQILNSRIASTGLTSGVEISFTLGSNNNLTQPSTLRVSYNPTSLTLNNVNGFEVQLFGSETQQNQFIQFLKARYGSALKSSLTVNELINLIRTAWEEFIRQNQIQNLPQISSCNVTITQNNNQRTTFSVVLANNVPLEGIDLSSDSNTKLN